MGVILEVLIFLSWASIFCYFHFIGFILEFIIKIDGYRVRKYENRTDSTNEKFDFSRSSFQVYFVYIFFLLERCPELQYE